MAIFFPKQVLLGGRKLRPKVEYINYASIANIE